MGQMRLNMGQIKEEANEDEKDTNNKTSCSWKDIKPKLTKPELPLPLADTLSDLDVEKLRIDRLTLSDNEESSETDDESDNSVISKGPERPRYEYQRDLRAQSSPIQVPQSKTGRNIYSSQVHRNLYSGYQVTESPLYNIVEHPPLSQVPKPVEELNNAVSSETELGDDLTIKKFIESLTDTEKKQIFNSIDYLNEENSKEETASSEVCASPDSGVGSMYSPLPSVSPPHRDDEPQFPLQPPRILMPAERVAINEAEMKTPAKIRLQNLFKSKKSMTIEWERAICAKEEVRQDKETNLIRALKSTQPQHFVERIFAHTMILFKVSNINLLMQKTINGETALSIAALKVQEHPLIARVIADSVVALNQNVDVSYDKQENGLLHLLVMGGDSYTHVLAELLNCTTPIGQPAFDVNKRNKLGETPLHIAVKNNSVAAAKLLLNHKADLNKQDCEEMTALHLATHGSCDPVMCRCLLQNNFNTRTVNLKDSKNNTALHYAAEKNDIHFERQKQVMSILINSGAQHNIHNSSGKLALALISPDRKEEARKIFMKKL